MTPTDDDRVPAEEFIRELRDKSNKGWVVVNWGPDPHRGPDTQVHLVVFAGPISLVVRLKSLSAVDELIAALITARNAIWPEKRH